MSDVFDRNIVLFIFFLVYLYMQFLSIRTRSQSGWNNLTCNPMNLFANSLFQSQEDANKDFERCIVNLSAATTTDLFQKEVAEQEEVMANMSGIQNEYTELTEAVNQYSTDISETTKDYTEQIEEIQESQNDANQLNNTTIGAVSQYIVDLQTIFNNITSYVQKK
jgi:hypothetical protein